MNCTVNRVTYDLDSVVLKAVESCCSRIRQTAVFASIVPLLYLALNTAKGHQSDFNI
jgi:hypothetical protein